MRRLLCGWVLLMAACEADRPRRYELSGQVTFKGQPVPVGTIVFVPDESKGNRGPGTSAGIADGRYRTPLGQGTIGGPHKVRLSGYDGRVQPVLGAPGGQTMPAGPPCSRTSSWTWTCLGPMPRSTSTCPGGRPP